MMTFLFLLLPSWYMFHFLEYVLHKLAHSKKYGGFIYKIHLKHHKLHYPLKNFKSPKPYKTSQIFIFSDGLIAFSLPISIIIYGTYNLLNYEIFKILIFQIFSFFYISDLLHTEIHLEDSVLEKYEWFLYLRNNHYIHHKTYNKNINIIDPTFDKLNKTFKNKIN